MNPKKRGQNFLQVQLGRGSEAAPASPCLFSSSFPLCARLAPPDPQVVAWQRLLLSHGPRFKCPRAAASLGVSTPPCPA